LQRLIDLRHTVQAVVTQPDRAKGRGRSVLAPPVKLSAEKHGIPVLQPERARQPECIRRLKELAPDVIVVVAYGQILPESILHIPPLGCINIHASLLPKYRGAAPIHRALIQGETETGITTMFMDKGMDTGDMLLKRTVPISPSDTSGTLHDTLSHVGAELLSDTLEQLEKGELERIPQNHELASYAPMLKKEDGRIDWNEPAKVIDRKVRGLFPWPGAYTYFQGKMVKLLEVAPGECPSGMKKEPQPGEVLELDSASGPLIASGQGCLRILKIQPQNKKAMKCSDFCRGYHVTIGARLGQSE
ncbi:MAG: methionyl-tRNA formyltransferase, partial [bacterium]|nr:methionyl-tRNA formyltransferase [bacterium]